MRKHSLVLIYLVTLIALIGGCSSAPRMVVSEKPEKIKKTGPETALIVFLRPNPLAFGGAEFILWDRNNFIGSIEPVSSVFYHAKPGDHIFMAKAENWDIVKGRIAAGKTYYIWIDPGVGVSGARVSMSVLDPDDKRVKAWLKICRPIRLNDPAYANVYEKKYQQQVAETLGSLKAGRANFTKLHAAQGK